MNKNVNSIANRLSLRVPQKDSLEILARIAEIISLKKGQDVAAALATIKSEFPSVEDFEREFPSLCFALATGVGKTRLMGAFIAYLHLTHGMKHFFVLAPNLTIYNKLITDFTPNTKKYVFQGIAEFAINPPEIITGDNYESGRGIRGTDLYGRADNIHINVFNISKINSEVRGGKAARIKRLSEYIGESYFEYLSKLDDLVLLMDESHRYRASAGVKAINELNPVIGLELTATPQIESGKTATPFKNVIYSYPLFKAMEDGYVKEPAVATRENFDAKAFNEEQLEVIKLEDAICIHENVKAELKVYADNNQKPYVKPFILVVAQDTGHAERLMGLIKSDKFFDGKYKDRVITVHSAQTGDEKDETVERLLAVENPEEPTEIVIHVNMLKEGWDVTNLYTIVPLRAANSRTLVEQSIGRGLRLPYGKRTGVSAVDRLTIVAHDKFDEIIKEANDQKSIIRVGVVIGKDISARPKQAVEIKSKLDMIIEGEPSPKEQKPLFSVFERPVAFQTIAVIKEFEKLPSSRNLQQDDIQKQIVARVEELMAPAQGTLEGVIEKPEIEKIVRKVTEAYIQNTIDIPRVIVSPLQADSYSFTDFDLDVTELPRLRPVDDNILIQHLRTADREQLTQQNGIHVEEKLEDSIVSALIDFDDISYDDHADLLYKLAGQMVKYISGYLSKPEDIKNVVQFYRQKLAELIHGQMSKHVKAGYSDYQASVTRGFERPKMGSVTIDSGEKVRPFRMNVDLKQDIRGMIFEGFKKCLYPQQKFDSDSERQFAVLLEDEKSVLKWFKPGRNDVKIYYSDNDGYEPDFVVETDKEKHLCEIKRADEVSSEEVQQKAKAAIKWCEFASQHEMEHGGKSWKYLLIPHDAVKPSATLAGLKAHK
jgi:type III restriction enzyme